MNTPAHLLLGAAVMGRPPTRPLIWAAMLGGLLPDLSLYVMTAVSILILDIQPSVVFRELYYSDAWMQVFAIDNSFILWGLLFGLAIWKKTAWAIALTGAALLHLACDFPLHHDDGRPQFWPLTFWIYESPFSYWDRDHGAWWIAPIEAALVTIAAISLWMRRPGVVLTVAIACLLAAEFFVVRSWLFFFIDS